MQRHLVILGALALGLGAVLLWGPLGRSTPRRDAALAPRSAPARVAPRAGAPLESARVAIDEGIADGGSGAPASASRTWTARGRLVDRASGAPIAGAELRASTLGPAPRTCAAVSKSDGSFELASPDAPEASRRLSVAAAGRPRLEARVQAGDGTVELGDLAVERGVELRVSTRVQGGGDVPSTLGLVRTTRADEPFLHGPARVEVELARGAATVRLPCGTWRLTGAPAGPALVEPTDAFELGPDGARRTLDVVLAGEGAAVLRGRVLDADAAPLVGARVLAVDAEGRRVAAARSGAGGAFALAGAGSPDGTVQLGLEGGAADPVVARWGDRGVLLRAHRPRTIAVRVAGPDGEEIGAFDVRWYGVEAAFGGEELGGTVRVARGEPARVALPSRGRFALVALPVDPAWAASEEHLVGPGARGAEVELRAPRARTLHVRVIDTDGCALGDSEVELRDDAGTLVADTRTDSGGQATLHVHPSARGLVARVRGETHLPAKASVGTADTLELVAERGLDYTGRLVPRESWLALRSSSPDLRARIVVDPLGAGRSSSAAVDGQGCFRLRALPSGDYRVTLVLTDPTRGLGDLRAIRGTFALTADRTDEEIDIVDLTPAELVGTVLDGGAPLAGTDVRLVREGDITEYFGPVLRTDDSGRFHARGLLPGTYRVRRAGPNEASPLSEERARLTAGDVRTAVFQLDP